MTHFHYQNCTESDILHLSRQFVRKWGELLITFTLIRSTPFHSLRDLARYGSTSRFIEDDDMDHANSLTCHNNTSLKADTHLQDRKFSSHNLHTVAFLHRRIQIYLMALYCNTWWYHIIFKSMFLKMRDFPLRLHWKLFEWTIFQHWFRKWIGIDLATSHYPKQWL